MTRIAPVPPNEAVGALAETYEAIAQTLGRVPNMAQVMGAQPIYLDMYMMMRRLLSEGRLDPLAREAIAITVARENDCDYCLAAHSSAAVGLFGADPDEVTAWMSGQSADAALGARLSFARRLLETRGAVAAEDLDAIRATGASDADIIEILGVVVMNIATNYFNRLADTDIDFPVPTK